MPSASPLPSFLVSLKIRDFRGIDSIELDFRGPDGRPNHLVVLAGPNGSGKTAILEAGLIAAGRPDLTSGPHGKRAIRKGSTDYSIEALIDSGGSEIEIVATSGSPTPDQSACPPVWYFSSWRAPNFIGAVNVTVGRPGRRPAKTDVNRLRNVKQQLANAAAAESFRKSNRSLFRSYSEWIALINDGWKKFYPDHDDEFSVGLVDTDDIGTGAFEVFYRRGNLPLISVDDLSAGQLELFLFLAALVLNDDRPGLIFIDEPELHLDPQWHAPIVRALMSLQPTAQFIVATHSPEIYDSAMSYERHFLVPDDDPRIRAWPQMGAGAET